jgi:hypothetical protein
MARGARGAGGGGRGSRYAEAARLARRGVPIALELYRRWQELTPEQRDRYLKMAREYTRKAGDAYAEHRGRISRGGQTKRPRRRT